MAAIRETTRKVNTDHFMHALKIVRPTIRKADIESVNKFKAAANMYR
jgi:SpoVK/Ycf46/Vps4 family AAA+-type ATPase